MRISDWSSDVCSSDLLQRRRSRKTSRPDRTSPKTAAVHRLRRPRPTRTARLLRDPNHDHPAPMTDRARSEEHTSELQSLMRNSYAVFCLKKKKQQHTHKTPDQYSATLNTPTQVTHKTKTTTSKTTTRI